MDVAERLIIEFPWFVALIIALYGAIAGSFFGCFIYRYPRKLSLRQPPSTCPHCHTRLGVPDLVPILSWLALKGRCRHCQTPMSMLYVWIESATVLAGLGVWFVMGNTWWLLLAVPAAWGAVLGGFYRAVAQYPHR